MGRGLFLFENAFEVRVNRTFPLWGNGESAAWPAGKALFPALLDESGLKPSLATTRAKASLRVIATL
ncbi:hypothetical protein DP73_04445 [Desulfosporosinus sp. HMP52]|nr:hypothetical protein DP73_04445 [Desulfosporosinus sp. HMP52]